MLKIVEQPNDWTKTMKSSKNLSDTKMIQLNFWQAFNDYAFSKPEFSAVFSKRKAQPQHWYSVTLRKPSYHLDFFVNTQNSTIGVEIYVQGNKELYHHFLNQKSNIESDLGASLEWKEASKDCAILMRTKGDIKKGEQYWNSYFDWLCESALKFRETFAKYDS